MTKLAAVLALSVGISSQAADAQETLIRVPTCDYQGDVVVSSLDLAEQLHGGSLASMAWNTLLEGGLAHKAMLKKPDGSILEYKIGDKVVMFSGSVFTDEYDVLRSQTCAVLTNEH